MKPTVTIDWSPESASLYRDGFAIVAIDVIRATTMAITAANLGRTCFPVASKECAFGIAKGLSNPLLAGELGGDVPSGFEMNNSPALLSQRTDVWRPLVLLSSSGTQLIANAHQAAHVYLACFRNSEATARNVLSNRHARVAVIGAGSRGEFREEDQICCAWIASRLTAAGYAIGNEFTGRVIGEWGEAPPEACLISHSVDYLRQTGQERDLDFILGKVNDLDDAFEVRGGQVHRAHTSPLNVPESTPIFASL